MAENKTIPNDLDVEQFLNSIADVDLPTLKRLIEESFKHVEKRSRKEHTL